MAEVIIGTSVLGNSLTSVLMVDELQPGDDVSYQAAKTIYSFHPLGAKMVDKPISIAQSQEREISIANDPGDRVAAAFKEEWAKVEADKNIANVMRLSRIYGLSSIIYGAKGYEPSQVIPPDKFAELEMYFNTLDPLNTAGSLIMNQDPNSPDFQKHTGISVAGVPYHRSRACVVLNEDPIYIQYTPSAFGFVGRSVFQRPLFPLKSFIYLMQADAMIAQKLGFLIAKQKQAGSIVDRMMQGSAAIKRGMIQEGKTGNVLSISTEEEIETLNMINVDGAGKYARSNILADIAAAASMPAMMINDETFAEGFGEGTEDAKDVARYINDVRAQMKPLYDWFTPIVQYRAWNERFYESLKAEYPDHFAGKPYKTAFFEWVNSFAATWPNLLIEPDSELAKNEKVILDAVIEVAELMAGQVDPENKATLFQWVADNLNDKKLLFKSPLILDWDAMANYEPPAPTMMSTDDPVGEPKAKAGKK